MSKACSRSPGRSSAFRRDGSRTWIKPRRSNDRRLFDRRAFGRGLKRYRLARVRRCVLRLPKRSIDVVCRSPSIWRIESAYLDPRSIVHLSAASDSIRPRSNAGYIRAVAHLEARLGRDGRGAANAGRRRRGRRDPTGRPNRDAAAIAGRRREPTASISYPHGRIAGRSASPSVRGSDAMASRAFAEPTTVRPRPETEAVTGRTRPIANLSACIVDSHGPR